MSVPASVTRYEPGVVIPALLGVTALAIFINHDVSNRQALLLLIGSGLGFSLFHAAFGFAGGALRFLFATRPAVIGRVLGIVYRTLATHRLGRPVTRSAAPAPAR